MIAINTDIWRNYVFSAVFFFMPAFMVQFHFRLSSYTNTHTQTEIAQADKADANVYP